jgi:hypothetical protein
MELNIHFHNLTYKETVCMCTVLPYSPLQEKCSKCGNRTEKHGASSFKKTGQI